MEEKLEIAKKHIKLEEFDKAVRILTELVQNDEFNIQAICELIKSKIALLEKKHPNFPKCSCRQGKYSFIWDDIDKIINMYNRVKKIDENNIVDTELGEYKEKITFYIELLEEAKQDEKECKRLTAKVQEIIKKCNLKIVKEKNRFKQEAIRYKMANELKEILGIESPFTNSNNGVDFRLHPNLYKSYVFNNINGLYRDGSISVDYIELIEESDNVNKICGYSKGMWNDTIYNSNYKIKNIEELENAINDYEIIVNKIVNDYFNKKNIRNIIIFALIIISILIILF